MRDQAAAQTGRFQPVTALCGWEGEHVGTEGSVRGGVRERESQPTEQNITHLTAKRDNFDRCPTCAGEKTRAL